MRRNAVLFTGLLAGLSLFAVAAPSRAAEPITVGEALKLPSRVLGEERTVLVSTPLRYAAGSERYPVLYLTDGDTQLLHTRGTVDFLARNGLMPEVIIVGLPNTDRTRDLSPTRWNRVPPDGKGTPQATGGGGGKFLDFFATELIPYVEAHYRTGPYRILAGHSLGGLFALEALTERPEVFDAAIAVSPALSWDADWILRQTEKFLDGRKELKRTLLVTMANEEKGTAGPTRFDRLRKILGRSKASGFVWDSKLMEDEDHGSVVLPSHIWALRRLFDGWRLPLDPKSHTFTGSVDDLKNHYAGLAVRFGVAAAVPERALNQVGYQHVLVGDPEGGMPFFRLAVELYPRSGNVYDSYGEALEKSGKKKEALASYERAVEVGKETGDPLLPAFTANRDRLAK